MSIGSLWMRAMPSAVVLAAALAGGGLLSGCGQDRSGSEGPDSGSAGGSENAGSVPDGAKPEQTRQGMTDGGAALVRADEQGRKWLLDIPLDVWWEDPLEVARNTQPVAAASNAGSSAESVAPVHSTPADPQPAPTEEPPADTGVAWDQTIGAEVLDREVKRILNRLGQRLQTLASYNSSHLELPPHIHTLAVLAAVAADHPGDIRWKENARYVRDLAARMAAEPLMPGARSYRALQEPFEDLGVIMSGSLPAGLPDVPEERPFAELAEFGNLMKRLEISSQWLRSNVGGEEALVSNKDEVLREAGVIAVLGHVVASPDYLYGDFEDFVDYARELSEAGRMMAEAAASENFADYDRGINRVYKACVDCHGVYR